MAQATEIMLGRKVKVISEQCDCERIFKVFLDLDGEEREIYWEKEVIGGTSKITFSKGISKVETWNQD